MVLACAGDNCVDVYDLADGGVFVGGNGVNLSVAVKRSGVECGYYGMIGNDENGRVIEAALKREGVDTIGLERVDGATGWTKVRLENGNRVFAEENLGVQRNYAISAENMERICRCDWVHYTAFTNWPTAQTGGIPGYYDIVKEHLSRFQARGVPASMDFSDGAMEELLLTAKDKVQIGFFSRSGMSDVALLREAEALLRYGFLYVVLTRGEQGSAVFGKEANFYQPAYPVEVVDTLGAGDAYIGAFLAAYIKQEPLRECARYAAWYAAQVCARYGGI